MMRVLRPSGRALLSVWIPPGQSTRWSAPLDARLRQSPDRRPIGLAWHDAGPVGELAERHGAQIRTHDGQLRITAASPEAYFDANEQHQPMSLAGRPLLERAGTYRDVRDAALAILCEGNQDPDAFMVSSPYRVIEVRPPMSAQHGTTNGTRRAADENRRRTCAARRRRRSRCRQSWWPDSRARNLRAALEHGDDLTG